MPKRFACVAVCALFLQWIATSTGRSAEQTEKFPDGTTHTRFTLDSKGKRQGVFTSYFPGGKTVQERARYDAGDLNGVREVYDEKGNETTEEAWIHGRLVFPRSPRMISAGRTRVQREANDYVFSQMKAPTNPHAPGAQPLARALAKLRTYRFIAGVPDDVTYDDSYINLCTYAGELLDKVGKLTHDPPHPAGVDDEAFKLGHDGCGRSNIFSSADIVGSVDAYMDDSDAGNIDRLGHRRWILNPKMGMTGFGAGSHYSAMYSFDGSRKDVPDYEFVSYPPPGYCPHDLFNASHAWHVSFNSAHYKVGDDVKAAIYPVDLKLNRANEPLELNYSRIDHGGFGISNAVIFRPKGFAIRPDVLYEVVITGVEHEGKQGEISYFVSFF